MAHGFVRPAAPGHHLNGGFYHPEIGLGFEVVGSALLDGTAERGRIRLFSLDGDGRVAVIGPEDVIADRVGQFASGTAPEMLQQARVLLALSDGLDFAHLDRRVREETTGDHGLDVLRT